MLGFLSVILLGMAIFLWVLPNLRRDPVSSVKFHAKIAGDERVVSKFPSPGEREAISSVRAGLGIHQIDSVTERFVLGSASPSKVIEYLQNLLVTEGAVHHFEWLGNMDANGLQMDGVIVHFQKDGAHSKRTAFLTPDEKGMWRIDFESFARMVKPSWKELLEHDAKQAVVRVIIGEDNYYNGPFSDDKMWSCYGMGSQDIDQMLIGYCKIGSPQAAALDWIFNKGENVNRVTLEICRVEGSSSRQFEITKVLAQDWVLGPKVFDEGF